MLLISVVVDRSGGAGGGIWGVEKSTIRTELETYSQPTKNEREQILYTDRDTEEEIGAHTDVFGVHE